MKVIFLKIKKIENTKQKGFALLFTVVIVGAIAVITAGLTSTIYKQMILSSLVKDSSAAFYEADTGADCALYADLRGIAPIGSTFLSKYSRENWSCGGMNLRVTGWDETDPNGDYNLSPFPDNNFSGPCFKIEVTRGSHVNEKDKTVTDTSIKIRGYNICEASPRTVEREIDVDYSG